MLLNRRHPEMGISLYLSALQFSFAEQNNTATKQQNIYFQNRDLSVPRLEHNYSV